MTLELSNEEIEARVKTQFLNADLLSITRMIRAYRKTGAAILGRRIYRLTRNKKFDYAFAEYIYRNTKIMVEVQ